MATEARKMLAELKGGGARLSQGVIREGNAVGDIEGFERGQARESRAKANVGNLLAVAQLQGRQHWSGEGQRQEGAALNNQLAQRVAAHHQAAAPALLQHQPRQCRVRQQHLRLHAQPLKF